MKKNKTKVQQKIRIGILLFFGAIILRRPFLWIVKLFPNYFDYVFFIYPGQKSDIGGYLPESFANNDWCRTQIFLGGIITAPQNNNTGRGIVIGAPSTVRSMVKSSLECEILKKRIQRIAESFSVKKIALAGRAPSIFLWNKVLLDDPFVHGRMGMVFCTIETLYNTAHEHKIFLEKSNIVIFGAGDVGKSIVDFLITEGYKTKIIRSKNVFSDCDQQLPETVKDVLHAADIVVVISAKGSDFHPYMKYLKDGVIIIGETHPPIRRPFPRGIICRAAVMAQGIQFVPSLKSYGDTGVPGCVVEAIVFSQYGEITDQTEFNKLARKIGFRARNVT